MILDWVPAHFPRDDFALARFDGTALYEHADPRRGAHPDWGTLVFNFGRHEVRNFLIANALFWLREYHVDGIRVDAVASMLYLDYSRERGRVGPQPVRRPRGPRRGRVPEGAQRGHLRPRARASISAAEESTAWPGVSRPTYLGGLGFGFKWNMGWMHDTLGYFAAGPDLPPLPPPRADLQPDVRLQRELHPAALPRRGRARQGLAATRRCPATAGRSSRTCARCTPTCGRIPARSCCSWARSSPRRRSGATSARSTGTCSSSPTTPASRRSCATSTASTATSRRCGSVDFDPAGFCWLEPNDADRNVLAFARASHGRRARARVRRQPLAGRRARATGSGCRAAAAGARCSTPTPRSTAAATSATSAASSAEPIPWHGQPCSAELTLPPLAALWLVPEAQ